MACTGYFLFMQRIFLTGGAGEIGKVLLSKLVERYHVRALFHRTKGRDHSRVEWVEGDLEQPDTYSSSLKGCTALIHVAAVTSNQSPYLHRMNVTATQKLIEAAQKNKCWKIIILGSASVTQTFRTPYAQSKLEMENMLRENRTRCVVLRPTLEYQKNSGYIRGLAHYCFLPLPFIPVVDGGRAQIRPVHADDIAQSVLRVLAKPFPKEMRVYDLASREMFSLRDLIEMVRQKNNIAKPTLSIPSFPFVVLCRALQWAGVTPPERMIAFAAMGQSYIVHPEIFMKEYEAVFINPHMGVRDAFE